MLLPLLSAVLFAGLASAAKPCADKNYNDETGWMQPQEIQEIFDLLLNSGDENGVKYDADLDSQKDFGKPTRGPTRPYYKNDVNTLKIMGTPAAALAANTGLNTSDRTGELSKASRMFIHITAVRQISGGRRGTLAFLLAHEFKHLINKDPENLEVNNLRHYDEWCKQNKEVCDTDDDLKVYTPIGDAARDAFLRPLEDKADLGADKWIAKLVDPKTGEAFGPQAGQRAIQDIGCWVTAMQKAGILEGNDGGKAQHASMAERLKALRTRQKQDQARLQRLKAKSAAAMGKASGL